MNRVIVVATPNRTLACYVARSDTSLYVSYPHSILPYEEAKYIGIRFGHLVENGVDRGMYGPALALVARQKMPVLVSEDLISLSLLEQTIGSQRLHLKVSALVIDSSKCFLYRTDKGMNITIIYPRFIIPRAEAKYIAARFGHLVPADGSRFRGRDLFSIAYKKMCLVSEDIVSLSLLERTI